MLIVQGVPPLGGIKQWWGGKTSYFVAVNISKTVGDTSKVTIIYDQQEVAYALSIDTKIDDLG